MRSLFIFILAAAALAGFAAQEKRPGRPGGGPPRPGLFASPNGEPFRGPDGEERWFKGADLDGDGKLTVAELSKDALRFFATLDVGRDGETDPDDLTRYETEIFPEMRVADARAGGAGPGAGGARTGGGGGGGGGGRAGAGGGGQGASGGAKSSTGQTPVVRRGAGRFSYLHIPEPIAAADTNMNRGTSAAEMVKAAEQRFALVDANGNGFLTLAELPRIHRGRPPGR